MIDELGRVFGASVPDAFLRDSVLCLRASYREAFEFCQENFAREEAHDLYPYQRRAMFERNWRALATRYPVIVATPQLNEHNNAYHTRVLSGRIVLTASAVETPTTLVPYAKYRKTYSLVNQLTFDYLQEAPTPTFYFQEPEPVPVTAPLYAILLHGPAEDDRSRLGFAHVVFPRPDCSGYAGRVDLIARFPDLAEMPGLDAAEIVADELPVRVRREARVQQES